VGEQVGASGLGAARKAQRHESREDELVRAAQGGDREAFDALVEMHGRAVLGYLERMGGPFDAEDLAQETLLQAFRRIGTFATGTDFRAWLLTIAYHARVHAVRRKRAVAAQDYAVLANVPAPSAPAGGTGLEAAMRSGLEALPEDQKTVVLLRFGQGLSHAEIARITETEEATVRWRLYRARRVLQKVLKEWAPTNKGSGT